VAATDLEKITTYLHHSIAKTCTQKTKPFPKTLQHDIDTSPTEPETVLPK